MAFASPAPSPPPSSLAGTLTPPSPASTPPFRPGRAQQQQISPSGSTASVVQPERINPSGSVPNAGQPQPSAAAALPTTVMLPGRGVIPLQYSLYTGPSTRTVQMESLGTRPGELVGLLRQLSVYPSYFVPLYDLIQSRFGGGSDWQTILALLLGFDSQDEFLGFGKHSFPGHDQLGWFPAFADQFGREYFDNVTAPPSLSLSPHDIQLCVRIPRQATRQQQNPVGAAYARPLSQRRPIEFPAPDEVLLLRPCGLPMWAFFWNSSARDVNSIAQHGELLAERYVRQKTNEAQWGLYKPGCVLEVRVISLDEQRQATALLQVRPREPHAYTFVTALVAVQAYRDEWSRAITELFTALARSDVQPTTVARFCRFIQHYWLHNMAQWARTKTSGARV